jgi:very-short-patch-repair endonuclease
VARDGLDDYRRQVAPLAAEGWQVLRLDEYELSAEFLDIIAVVERPLS